MACQRALLIFAFSIAALLPGCRSSAPSRSAGADIPTVPGSSVALPGANDAADAPHAPSVAESRNAELTTYRDPASGVSFRYPTVWRPATGQNLPAPEFEAGTGAPRITQEFRPEGTVYGPTVLKALAFSYTVQPHSNAKSCRALPKQASPNANEVKPVNFNGRTYTEVHGGDAAMCTHVSSTIDSTLEGTQCFVFERDFVTSCPYVKSQTLPRPLTQEESSTLQQQLDAVMQSVVISPRH